MKHEITFTATPGRSRVFDNLTKCVAIVTTVNNLVLVYAARWLKGVLIHREGRFICTVTSASSTME